MTQMGIISTLINLLALHGIMFLRRRISGPSTALPPFLSSVLVSALTIGTWNRFDVPTSFPLSYSDAKLYLGFLHLSYFLLYDGRH